ncbi:MAG: hypothetical protein CMJ48_05375 [Planctomycetaceae bacterium]|nr:hypothetical protein [Planctomycetaceae bacterium]
MIARLKSDRKKDWDRERKQMEADLRRQLASAKPKLKREQREELEARLKQLGALAKGDDSGPAFDCVLFDDGKVWRAVIDTDADGDLAEETALASFREERQYGTFGFDSLLNFGVNIFDDGTRLSIVVDCGSHGTHVAGIVAGHHPEQPELNGLAPGAQIVSVKIGDTRLGSMETTAGLVRGLAAVVRNKCDLINMSYSEPTRRPDVGRLARLFSEIVNKHNVIFVSAAANDGPALSTVGGSGGGMSAVIGVGAYLSPEMMRAQYAARRGAAQNAYGFSSRGPALDGQLAISLFAPGGAIASVPEYSLRPLQQMNGTSMASPNACGSIALMLSSLKTRGARYTPHSVRRALENTTKPVEGVEVFAQGPGLIQIADAVEYHRQHENAVGEMLSFDVRVLGEGGSQGVYLREPEETSRTLQTRVRVRPLFPEEAPSRARTAFQLPISLEATQEWVSVGEQLLLTHGGATFDVQVDAANLESGVHFAEILGHDAGNDERGPLFRVPVTVVKPEPAAALVEGRVSLSAGTLARRFLSVPEGATWADLTLRSEADAERSIVCQTVQLRSGRTFREGQSKSHFRLRPGEDVVRSFAVSELKTLEVCLAQSWSSPGDSEVSFELAFQGIVPSSREIALPAGEAGTVIALRSPLGKLEIAPQGSLRTRRSIVSPASAVVRPLSGPRDVTADGEPLYELKLTYRFEQDAPGRVTPRFPANDGLVYDSKLGTHLWMLFDAHNRRIASDDVYPSSVQLAKGEYRLVLQLRHEDPAALEKLKGSPLLLDRALRSPVSIGMFTSRIAALSGDGRFKPGPLLPGETRTVFLATPSGTAGARPGDVLLGGVTFGKEDSQSSGAGRKPGGFSVRYTVPVKPIKAGATASAVPKTQRAFDILRLKATSFEEDRKAYDELEATLLKAVPDDVPLLMLRLERLDADAKRKERLTEVVAAADAVLKRIDRAKLAQALGARPVTAKERSAHGKAVAERDRLADVLYRKVRALGAMDLPEVVEQHPVEDPQELERRFNEAFSELQRWVDTKAVKYVSLQMRRERRRERWGVALGLLNGAISKEPSQRRYYEERRDLYEQVGWETPRQREAERLLARFPPVEEPF